RHRRIVFGYRWTLGAAANGRVGLDDCRLLADRSPHRGGRKNLRRPASLLDLLSNPKGPPVGEKARGRSGHQKDRIVRPKDRRVCLFAGASGASSLFCRYRGCPVASAFVAAPSGSLI